jgi:hypothetical protein
MQCKSLPGSLCDIAYQHFSPYIFLLVCLVSICHIYVGAVHAFFPKNFCLEPCDRSMFSFMIASTSVVP